MILRRNLSAGLAFALFSFAALFGLRAFAQTGSGSAPTITVQPTASDVTETSAVITWTTDVESTTVVDFGTTSALGQEFKKIVPIEDTEVTELRHSMTLWGLQADTTVYFLVKSTANGQTATSSIEQFKTVSAEPTCTADTYVCGDWSACSADGKQTQDCTLKTCPGGKRISPMPGYRTCTPPPAPPAPKCAADEWNCGDWAACSSDGKQSRTCTMKTDCAAADTPKPAESQSCTPSTPKCTADTYVCGVWSACSADGKQTQDCTLKTCPGGKRISPMPGYRTCSPPTSPPDRPPVDQPTSAKAEAVATLTNVDVNAPPQPEAIAPPKAPNDECAKAGILPARCESWLEAKYGNNTCREQGIFIVEDCIKYLTDKNGGVFPGCEGKSKEVCGNGIAMATVGYMTAAERARMDDLIATKGAKAAFEELGDDAAPLIAVRSEKKGAVIWWPSLKTEGLQTSPGMIIFDTDKDGLPDDLERRLGTDPLTADIVILDAGQASSVTPRNILKSFFEVGAKPKSLIAVDSDGDGTIDRIEDRNLLGLKEYNPSKSYLIGDTAVFSNPVYQGSAKSENPLYKENQASGTNPLYGSDQKLLKSFFQTGDFPTQDMLGYDPKGNGPPLARVSRAVLKAFFERGDKPTSAQFSSLVDTALLRGLPIGQPLGLGETDATFTLQLGTPPSGSDARRNQEQDTQDVAKKTERPAASNVLSGHAAPNTIVVLYVYSYVPMVLSTTTDANGDFTYDLADNVVDGTHTAYVAVTDETGKVTKKSGPLSLFVKDALAATSESEFLRPDVNVASNVAVANYGRYYVYGTLAAMFLALGITLAVFKRKGAAAKVPPPTASR
jgi:hypothetical protein